MKGAIRRPRVTSRVLTIAATCAFIASAVAVLTPGAGASPIANGKISFNRIDVALDVSSAFTIDPDGSNEAMVQSDGDIGCREWSPDSSKLLCGIFLPSGWPRPATANPDGSDFTVLDGYPDQALFLAAQYWSPDAARILLSITNNPDPSTNGLYTVRSSDGGNLTRVTTSPDTYSDLPFGYSPDGSRILFNRVSDFFPHALYAVNPNGTGLLRLSPPELSVVDNESYDVISADWSPDGSQVAFAAAWKDGRGRGTALYVVNADGTGLRQITPSGIGALSAQWSPDDRQIAFTSKGRADPQVWVVNADGTGLAKITQGTHGSVSTFPVWSPDSAKLLFERVDRSSNALWTINRDGTELSKLADIPMGTSTNYAWGAAPPS
jgi:Tol biopolymer transport system component